MANLKALWAYILTVLLAVDQVFNALLGGTADESLSARAWRGRNSKTRWAVSRAVIDAIFRCFGQRNHCRDAFESEQLRRQLPREYRMGS